MTGFRETGRPSATIVGASEIVHRMAGATVVCAGDVMLDHFVYGAVSRISPEAPIPVFAEQRVARMLGGAGNVARNLAALGVNADALLAQMNASRTTSAPPFARNYVERYADYSGRVKKPLLTLHTQTDTLVPVSHESAYAATVSAAGRSDMLAQAFTTGNGHCNFTGPQLLTALGALDQWVATGVAPGAASFPAALGFIPGFVPPPWPQP